MTVWNHLSTLLWYVGGVGGGGGGGGGVGGGGEGVQTSRLPYIAFSAPTPVFLAFYL